MPQDDEKTIVENVNVPGSSTRVNAAKYAAMKRAFEVKAHLPEDLFPQGKTSGWWAKTVQLDLEAKGIVTREKSKPLRWHKTSRV